MNNKNDNLEIQKTAKSVIGSQQPNPNKDNFREDGTINVRPFLDKSDGGTLDNFPNQIPLVTIFAVMVVIGLMISKLQDIRDYFSQFKLSEQANIETNQDNGVSRQNTQLINSQAIQEKLPDTNKIEAEAGNSENKLLNKNSSKINQDNGVSRQNTQLINSQAIQEQLPDTNKIEAEAGNSENKLLNKNNSKTNQDDAVSRQNTQSINSQAIQEQLLDTNIEIKK